MKREDLKAIDHFMRDIEIVIENIECYTESLRDQYNKLKRVIKRVKSTKRDKSTKT